MPGALGAPENSVFRLRQQRLQPKYCLPSPTLQTGELERRRPAESRRQGHRLASRPYFTSPACQCNEAGKLSETDLDHVLRVWRVHLQLFESFLKIPLLSIPEDNQSWGDSSTKANLLTMSTIWDLGLFSFRHVKVKAGSSK